MRAIRQLQAASRTLLDLEIEARAFKEKSCKEFELSLSVTDISILLTFDDVIIHLNLLGEDETLIEYARLKFVLDVWIEAWMEAKIGLLPFLYKAWLEDRHL